MTALYAPESTTDHLEISEFTLDTHIVLVPDNALPQFLLSCKVDLDGNDPVGPLQRKAFSLQKATLSVNSSLIAGDETTAANTTMAKRHNRMMDT